MGHKQRRDEKKSTPSKMEELETQMEELETQGEKLETQLEWQQKFSRRKTQIASASTLSLIIQPVFGLAQLLMEDRCNLPASIFVLLMFYSSNLTLQVGSALCQLMFTFTHVSDKKYMRVRYDLANTVVVFMTFISIIPTLAILFLKHLTTIKIDVEDQDTVHQSGNALVVQKIPNDRNLGSDILLSLVLGFALSVVLIATPISVCLVCIKTSMMFPEKSRQDATDSSDKSEMKTMNGDPKRKELKVKLEWLQKYSDTKSRITMGLNAYAIIQLIFGLIGVLMTQGLDHSTGRTVLQGFIVCSLVFQMIIALFQLTFIFTGVSNDETTRKLYDVANAFVALLTFICILMSSTILFLRYHVMTPTIAKSVNCTVLDYSYRNPNPGGTTDVVVYVIIYFIFFCVCVICISAGIVVINLVKRVKRLNLKESPEKSKLETEIW